VRPAQALDDYFEHVANLFASGSARLVETRAVVLEGASEGLLRLDVQYRGNPIASEGIRILVRLFVDVSLGYPVWLDYSFHVMQFDGTNVFRYDNAPHHREVVTFPHHKHVGADERVTACEQPSIHLVAAELATCLETPRP